jgi:Gpi18-like mannosyltransferase
MKKWIKKLTFKKVLFIAILIRAIFIFLPSHGDVQNHVIWGRYAADFSLRGYYDWLDFFIYAKPNQPPLTILTYGLMREIYNFLDSILYFLNMNIPLFPSNFLTWFERAGYEIFLKLPSSIADILLGVLIYFFILKLGKDKKAATFGSAIFLLNPFTFYNSAIWGQTDAYVNLPFIFGVFLFVVNKPLLSPVFFTLSVLTKLSLVIYTPIFLILLIKKRFGYLKTAVAAALSAFMVYLIAGPFSHGPFIPWLVNLYTKNIVQGELHDIVANAFNFWALFYGFSPIKDSSIVSLGLSAYTLGFILFGIYLGFLGFILLREKFSFERFLFALALTSFGAFMLLTRMHERYLFPIFIPLAILTALKIVPSKVFYLLSALHLINLYHFWWYPPLSFLKEIFSNFWVEKMLIILTIGVFIYLNKLFLGLKKG